MSRRDPAIARYTGLTHVTRLMRLLGAVPGSPLRGFITSLFWFTVACAIAALLLSITDLGFIWWMVAAIFAAAGAFSLVVIALISRPYVRDIDQIREQHFAHWVYAADEWARFEEAEWQREKQAVRIYPLFSLILALVVGGLALVVVRDALIALAAFGLFIAIGIIVTLQTWGIAWQRYRQRHRAAGDVYFSLTGILLPRMYLPHTGFNLRVTEAEVVPGDPDVLRVRVASYNEDAIRRFTDYRIPVPYGREDEAREVAQQLLGASAARGYQAKQPVR